MFSQSWFTSAYSPFRCDVVEKGDIVNSSIPIRIVLCLVFASPASAEMIEVVNHSFEDISGESPYNEFTFGPLNGWGLYDPLNITSGGAGPSYYIGTLQPTAPVYFIDGASDGQRVAIAFNYAGTGGTGEYGLQQTLSATLQANMTYVLQVDIGNIASGTGVDGTYYNLDGFPGYRVDLMAGGQVIASDNNSLAGAIPEGQFGLSTIQLTTDNTSLGLNQQLGIRLVSLNQVDPLHPGADLEVDFDNVRLQAFSAVPEPSSIVCLAVASLTAVGTRMVRRRRKLKS
jgi:hypothetical protein